jgi:WD40 repeat protein
LTAHRLRVAPTGGLVLIALSLAFISSPISTAGDALPAGAIHRYGSTQFRPGGRIHTMIPMSNGKDLITVSSGGLSVCLWNARTGELRRSWSGEGMCAAALSTDECVLAIAQGHETGLYDPHTGLLLRKLTSKNCADISAVAFRSNSHVVAADEQGLIQVWNCDSGNQERSFAGGLEMPRILIVTPDGNQIVASNEFTGRVRSWDTRAGQVSYDFAAYRPDDLAPSQMALSLAASPDGKTLLVAGAHGIQLRDMASGRVLHTFARAYRVTQACYSPNARTLAAIENDRQSLVIYEADGPVLRRIPCTGLDSIAFSQDGRTVFGGGWSIDSWDVASGKPGHKDSGQSATVAAVVVSPDGKELASGGAELCAWNVANERLMFKVHCDEYGIDAVSFRADGDELVTRNAVSLFSRWDAQTGKQKLPWRLPRGTRATYVPATDRFLDVVSVSVARVRHVAPGIEVRNWQNDKVITKLKWPGGPIPIDEIVESPDARTYVGRTRPDQVFADLVFAWRASDGQLLNDLGRALSPESTGPSPPPGMQQITGPARWLERKSRLSFSSDSRLIAVIRQEASLGIWELDSRSERFRLNAHGPLAVAFSPDGRALATAGKDGAIRLWDQDSGSEVGLLQGQRGNVNCLVFSPDSKRLFSGADDTTVVAWDVAPFFQSSRKPDSLSAAAFETCWQDLQKPDAAEAFKAMHQLIATGTAIVPAFRRHLQPEAADQEHVNKLIRALDDDRYDRRQDATRALEWLGERAGPALHKALGGPMSVEARSRAEAILGRLGPGGVSALRSIRAIEVLERLRSPDATALIQELSKGDQSFPISQAAQAALQRLRK